MSQNFTDVFGSDVVPPSAFGYSFVNLTENTTFNWPENNTQDLVSQIMDVAAASVGLSMIMPPANQVSPGRDLLIRNVGMNLMTVKDNVGTVIANIQPSAVVYLFIAENDTLAGTWGQVAFGVGTSSIDAATLVGYGIKAIGPTLNQAHPVLTTASGLGINETHRAQLVNFTGGVETVSLAQAGVLGDDFFTIIRNSGTGTLTVDPFSGELIDGTSTLDLQPGESFLLFCNGVNWFTVGYGRSVVYNFTQLVKDVSAGGTFVLTPSEASNQLLTFIGNPIATVEVIVPSVVAVYYILNSLTTPQSVTVKTAIGTGVAVPQGQRIIAICDSTNVYSAQSVQASTTLSLIDGSVANPSLNFASQTNTGIYKYSTSGLGIAVAGVDIAHYEPSGTTFNGASPIVSAKIGPAVGQQHTVPAVNSDTLAVLNAAQTLINKTLVVANNIITTAAAPGLTATELNAALAELSADILAITTDLSGNYVQKVAQGANPPSTGAARIPVGTTAQRPPDEKGLFRYNDTLDIYEGFIEGVGWGQVGGGQMYGAAQNKAIFYNNQTIGENLTILSGSNGGTFGPVTVNNGFTVTVENGSVWTVV